MERARAAIHLLVPISLQLRYTIPPMSQHLPRRRSVRLPYYNYASYGWYFVTVCCDNFKPLLGTIESAQFRPSPIGRALLTELQHSVEIRQELHLDVFVIMPNNLHAVVVIKPGDSQEQLRNTRDEAGKLVLLKAQLGGQARSLSSFVGGLKSTVTSGWRKLSGNPDLAVWNRGFHEHVVRTEPALHAIRNYIVNNPLQWELDRYNKDRQPGKSADDKLEELLAADKQPGT